MKISCNQLIWFQEFIWGIIIGNENVGNEHTELLYFCFSFEKLCFFIKLQNSINISKSLKKS